MKRFITIGLVVVLMGLLSAQSSAPAQASVSQDSGTNGSPLCWYWHFREFRDGLFVSGLLWQITQSIYWCGDGYGHFNGTPTETHGHKEGSTWLFGGWDSITAIHKTDPSRWYFRIDATEIGNASGIFNEHNYPYIRMTVYPTGPGQSTWSSSCGCKATIGAVPK